MKYLVAVERPLCSDDSITVTDDYEGFGPDLLATYPIEKVEADSPLNAARQYAERHGLFPIRAFINLPDEASEWMLDEDGSCEL